LLLFELKPYFIGHDLLLLSVSEVGNKVGKVLLLGPHCKQLARFEFV